ncbi:ATP-binding cassette, subfamily C, CydCD [Quadrisphaera granulorum]|uniref:ATP-binding cassette subfamily C protein CydCD n=1 Tax=Quadrisphaera granulorum TaxID=317664 RepID=A0A316A8R4_9ACTN|nr:thiol reductant ABC exporter subunit CydC [Quadrisphaera granulorum]PWJ54101.1 ATP-binding cassette subfamily C protein CydCD [Quadrisphaera granulorum]SZE96240.1 ATP-binding cassette, subfamily C, CydCD [Quadrisphaera granulorum]
MGSRPPRSGPSKGPVDPRLLRHARAARRPVAGLVVVGAAQVLVTLLVAIAVTGVVVALVLGARDGASPSPAGYGLPVWAAGARGVGLSLAVLAGAFAARALLARAESVLAARAGSLAVEELRTKVLQAALQRGPAWVAAHGAGRVRALVAATTGPGASSGGAAAGLDALRPWFSGYLPSLVVGVLMPPVVVLVLVAVDWRSALIVLVTLPLVPIFAILIGWATQRRAAERVEEGARLAGHFLDVVRGLALLRVHGRAQRQVGEVAATTERHREATLRVLRVAFLSSTALDLVGTLSVGLVAVETGLRVADGSMPLAPALLVILLAPEAYRPLREVGARFHASADAAAVVAEVDAVLTAPLPNSHRDHGHPTTCVTDEPPSVSGSGLRVRHAGRSVDALSHDLVVVRGGELVALQGPSGAGKTTLLRVLAGVQPLTAGTVETTGRVLLLTQDPLLPHARSIRDALLLDEELAETLDDDDGGRGDDGVSRGAAAAPADAELLAALELVGLRAEVEALPAGLGTPIGERAAGLSTGQRQRLALARVLRAAGRRPVVLLLDEPTAHLDAASEARVVAALRAAADAGSAVLVAAHRPALLAAVDRTVSVTPPTTSPPVIMDFSNTALGTVPEVHDHGELVRHAHDHGREGGWWARFFRAAGRRPGTAVALGAASWLAGATLTAAATWLLVRASELPPVLTLSAAVVTVRGSAVARPLLRYLERLASHEVALRRLAGWRSAVLADLVPRVPGPGLLRRGDLLTRLVGDVDARLDGLLRGRLPAAAALAAVVVVLGVLSLLDPLAALGAAVGFAVAVVAAPALAARAARRTDAALAVERSALADAAVETVDAVDELAARAVTAGTATALAVPRSRGRDLAAAEVRAAGSAGTATALAHLGTGLAVVGAALGVWGAVTSGRLGAEGAAVVVLVVLALAEPVLGLVDAAVARERSREAVRRLASVAQQPPSVDEWPGRSADVPVRAPLEVRGLVAGWDPDRPPALDGLDLHLAPGERVAVLGPSGSGKSTLGAVVARLLDPRAGTVTLGGVEVRDLDADAVRRRVGLVSEATEHLFATTLRANLALAAPDAADEELVAVLRRVRLGDWFARLPDGLDTWLGDGGSTVSGGERRRLAAARALLPRPDVLVLDEPTEGLDEPTAQALVADLLGDEDDDGERRPSVLLLTHRLEGVDRCDVVLDLAGALTPRA